MVNYSGFSKTQLNSLQKIIERRKNEIIKNGKNISKPEITNISEHGFWIFLKEKEYFVSFNEYPWFKDANVSSIIDVEIIHNRHLYWPRLDVDLSTEILDNPEKYTLTYR